MIPLTITYVSRSVIRKPPTILLQDNYAKVDSSKVFYYISEDEAGDESEIGWWYVGGIHEGEKVESSSPRVKE